MSMLRIIGGFLSLGMAGVLIFHVAAAFQIILSTLRQFGQEQTYYYVLNIGIFSLSGGQLLIFEGVLLLLIIGFILLGVYLIGSDRPSA